MPQLLSALLKRTFIVLLVLAALVGWHLFRHPAWPSQADAAPTLEAIEEMASLMTYRLQISDVVTEDVSGHLGSNHCALLVRGDVLLTIDLKQARFEKLDHVNRQAVLLLPNPQATSPRVDHSATRLILIDRRGLWQLNPFEPSRLRLINLTYARAQRAIEARANDPELIQLARQRAIMLIKRYGQSLDWQILIPPEVRPPP